MYIRTRIKAEVPKTYCFRDSSILWRRAKPSVYEQSCSGKSKLPTNLYVIPISCSQLPLTRCFSDTVILSISITTVPRSSVSMSVSFWIWLIHLAIPCESSRFVVFAHLTKSLCEFIEKINIAPVLFSRSNGNVSYRKDNVRGSC